MTLVPRGQARGLTWFIPADDPTLISKQQLFARIVGGLGGRAAEEVIFGEPEVTTGAAGDLQQITGLAKQVIQHLHMLQALCNAKLPLVLIFYFFCGLVGLGGGSWQARSLDGCFKYEFKVQIFRF